MSYEGDTHEEIAEKLKQKKGKRVLNVHVSGSFAPAMMPFPTQNALNSLRTFDEQGEQLIVPCMFFAGPYHNKYYGTASRPSGFGWLSWTGLRFAWGDIYAVFAGTSIKNNTDTLLEELLALEKDGLLPDEIFLSGHSLGGVNCIDMANKIYQQFGHKIKVHLCLTDPVPGPGRWHQVEEKVIPPNVVSFTAFYAEQERNILLTASDLSRLVFTNPNTTVTSYSLPEGHKSLTGNKSVLYAICELAAAVNGLEVGYEEESIPEALLLKPNEMKGKTFMRADASFYRSTPIHPSLSEPVKKIINKIRSQFDSSQSEIESDSEDEWTSKENDEGCIVEEVMSDKKGITLESKNKKTPAFFEPEFEETDEFKRKPDYYRELAKNWRTEYLYLAYREEMRARSHVSYGEFIAFLLIIPTLGFSANLYRSSQEMQAGDQIYSFLANLMLLNLESVLDLTFDTGDKLAHNLLHGGVFRPDTQEPIVDKDIKLNI